MHGLKNLILENGQPRIPTDEICVGVGATVDHYLLHFHDNGVNDIHVNFKGEGGQYHLYVLYDLIERQQVSDNIEVTHNYPNCVSTQIYRGVVRDRATFSFNSLATVNELAYHSEVSQQSKALLLSKHATVTTNPQLKIFNDDVKASHGATIGSLDDDAMYYLQTRGLDEEQAKQYLISAFINEIVQQINNPSVRDFVESYYA